MSLGHSEATRGQSVADPALEPASDDRQVVLDESWPTLADGVVPMRDGAQRELDRERHERVRLVVKKRRRPLPHPPVRGLAFAAAGLATILLGVAVVSAANQAGGSSPSEHPAASTQQRIPALTSSSRSTFHATQHREARARARAQRRAAIRAHREAARRRAKQRSTRMKAAARARRKQRAAAPREPASNSAASVEAPPPAPTPASAPLTTTATAPPPPAASPPSSSASPAQSEFGFER